MLASDVWPAWTAPSLPGGIPGISVPGLQVGPHFTKRAVVLSAFVGLATVGVVVWALSRKSG